MLTVVQLAKETAKMTISNAVLLKSYQGRFLINLNLQWKKKSKSPRVSWKKSRILKKKNSSEIILIFSPAPQSSYKINFPRGNFLLMEIAPTWCQQRKVQKNQKPIHDVKDNYNVKMMGLF